MRTPAVIAACCLVVWCGVASADAVGNSVRDLKADSYKVRLSAALALAKSKDARAIIGLADAVVHDEDATIRRISALALEKMVDGATDDDARELALSALDQGKRDPEAKVSEAAERVYKALEGYRKKKKGKEPESSSSGGGGGMVFVNIDVVQDQSKKLPSGGADRLTKVVKQSIEATGYATTWGTSGALPTSQELGKARGFIVASTVKTIDITKSGHQTQIACTVSIRVAPWGGKDTGERWEANKAASATGSAKATTGSGDKDIASGVKDCIEAVGQDVTKRQVVPFLAKLAAM